MPTVTPERFAQGLTFAQYLAQMRSNKERFEQRMADAVITPADREAIRGRKLKVLVITEDWCGDALVGFPALARLVEGAPDVEMRVFLRDANPDVMDQYLKRGLYRTIPVIVFFDEQMNELARYLERQDVVTELRTLLKVWRRTEP
jgi:hypothetical protein